MKFSIKDFLSKRDQVVTFTKEILNGNFIFCAVVAMFFYPKPAKIMLEN